MGFIKKMGSPGYFHGNVFVRAVQRGRNAFMASGDKDIWTGPVILDAKKDVIVITSYGQITATTFTCGITYRVNGGIAAAPSFVFPTVGGMEITMQSPVVCGDVVTFSYDSTGCDLAVDGDLVESSTDNPVENRVSSPLPVITVQPTSQSSIEPDPLIFTITATGALTYQWVKNGVDVSGATSPTWNTGATTVETFSVHCRLTNDCGKIQSDTVTGTVGGTLNVIHGADNVVHGADNVVHTL